MRPTLKDLMDSALVAADFPRDSLDANQKKTLIQYLNEGGQELWAAMVDARQEMVFRIAPLISIVAGTEAYALPDDFYKAIKVWLLENSRRWVVEKFQLDELEGYPQPVTTGSIEMWYAPAWPKMSEIKAPVPGIIPNGWERYIYLYAACRLLADEQTDFTMLAQERDGVLQMVRQTGGERDGEPESIGDVYGRIPGTTGGSYLREALTRQYRYRIMGTNIYFAEIEFGGA